MSLTNESVAVVTGAASGIGRELAIQLAREGIAGLAIADVNAAALEETISLITNRLVRVTRHVINIADRTQVQSLVTDVVNQHGRATHVVNNAGVSLFGDIEQVSIEDLEWLMNVNFWGAVYGTKFFLPVLREQQSAHIVNVSSVLGFIAAPGNAAYSSSKFALRGFTEALRYELAGTSVAVSCVFPGGIATNIARDGRVGASVPQIQKEEGVQFHAATAQTTPKAAAQIIINGIKRREPQILIGADAHQIHIVSRLFPRNWLRVLNLLSGGKLLEYRKSRQKTV